MKSINLFIIGAQKSGTTSLYNYLKSHSNIYFSEVKELTYFVNKEFYSRGKEYLHSFFPNYKDEKILASSYVHMLPCIDSIQRTFEYNPNMKFIVVLREPISRAYSAYNYAIKNGWEESSISFKDSIAYEAERVKDEKYDLTYFYNGLYNQHLSKWMEVFPKNSFFICRDIDLRNSSIDTLQSIYKFLDIDDESYKVNTSKEYNKAGKVKFPFLQKFLLKKNSFIKNFLGYVFPSTVKVFIRSKVISNLYKFNQVDKENKPLDESTIQFFSKYFQDDLNLLENKFGVKFN